LPITWATDVQMPNARAFSISTLQDLSNDTKNTPMRGVLGPVVELWTFGSPGGPQIPNFSKCWASPPHLAKLGLRHQPCYSILWIGNVLRKQIQRFNSSYIVLTNCLRLLFIVQNLLYKRVINSKEIFYSKFRIPSWHIRTLSNEYVMTSILHIDYHMYMWNIWW